MPAVSPLEHETVSILVAASSGQTVSSASGLLDRPATSRAATDFQQSGFQAVAITPHWTANWMDRAEAHLDQVETLLGLALLSRGSGMHVKARSAAIDLRRADLYQFHKAILEAALKDGPPQEGDETGLRCIAPRQNFRGRDDSGAAISSCSPAAASSRPTLLFAFAVLVLKDLGDGRFRSAPAADVTQQQFALQLLRPRGDPALTTQNPSLSGDSTT